jgi:hypothetical protein
LSLWGFGLRRLAVSRAGTRHSEDTRGRSAAGPQMAVRAAGALMPADVVAAACAALASDLLEALGSDK